MKKLWTLAAFAVLALLAGCKGEDVPEEPVDFAQSTYTLYNGGHVSVGLAVVDPVSYPLTIPLEIEGPVSDVTIIPQEITIPADDISGGLVITDKSLSEGDRLVLSVNPPKGYMPGKRGTASVVYDPREALDCDILGSEFSFVEDMEIMVRLTGVRSGAEFKAEDRLIIPVYFTGDGGVTDGSDEVVLNAEMEGGAIVKNGFIVEKGTNIGKAHLIRSHTTDIERPLTARLGIADFADTRIRSAGHLVVIHIPKTEKKD